jgi:hypothetical protein
VHRAETSVCAARRQATALEGLLHSCEGGVARQDHHRRSVRPPTRLPARRSDRSAPSLALSLPSHPFFAPSSLFFLPPPILFASSARSPTRRSGRHVQTARPPGGGMVFFALPAMSSVLSYATYPLVLQRVHTCRAVRATPYVLRRTCCAVPHVPRRACHAVRGQICLKDVFKNGCVY